MPSLNETSIAHAGAIPSHQLGSSPREVADYIEQMSGEMVALAEQSGLGFLAYLLEVAREEAALHRAPQRRQPVEMHGERPPTTPR